MTDPFAPTVLGLIEAGAARLEAAGVSFGHGTGNAFDEAAWLVLWQLGLPLGDLDEVAQTPVSSAGRALVDALLQRRVDARCPAAYLTQEAWLQGVPFYIDARAIVPRSFIAELIADGSIDPWLGEHTRCVLDLCTGNGSLAVLAALAWPNVTIDAADLSPDALAVAAINVEKHALEGRIRPLESDGLANCDGRYDLILCNPPYVTEASMAALPAEHRAEPALALAGGVDGMAFIQPMLAAAAGSMTELAVLVLEVGHERAHFEAAFPTLEVVWLETSAGDEQVLLVTREALLAAKIGR